ncbi:Unknown protein [Striga hermonthica]|uniref:Uncharacterized protein n=1 Tax=Striga hermonthica TaxID=68872 RepID=A0A9N7MZN5_STRHE|nr:Unknown protein [Striga hermonthica]
MAIARILSQSQTRSILCPPAALIGYRRHRSSKTHRAQLIEVDLESSPSESPEAAVEVITSGIRKLEEAIHTIIVRRAAPDWLPFLPGHSYWVPPRATSMRSHSAGSVIEVLGKLASLDPARGRRSQGELLSEDQQMALESGKGWPSSAFFIEGTSPMHPMPVVEVQVKIQVDENSEGDTSSSEDDEEG